MKKSLQIAVYDFKRLMTNPYTIAVMVVLLIFSLIFSAAYQIPTEEEYSATTSGSTTLEIYNNFKNGTANATFDTKASMSVYLDEASAILEVFSQSDEDDEDLSTLNGFYTTFSEFYNEFDKYGSSLGTYLESDLSDLTTAAEELAEFLEYYSNLSVFTTRIVFTESDYAALEKFSAEYTKILSQSKTNTEILDDLVDFMPQIKSFLNILQNKSVWHVSSDLISQFEADYITAANTKLEKIEAEIASLSSSNSNVSSVISSQKSAITAYKLTCQSAKAAILNEFYLLFNDHFGTSTAYYNIDKIASEELELALTKAAYYIEDESLYYTQAQVALNFNTASYQITAYDATYTMMAIIGFLTVLFGIFCAYKLFGNDRKKGKIDILLSQNVSFGQVFSGTVFSIVLCTTFILTVFCLALLIWNLIFHGSLAGCILTVFNLSSAYTIHPFLFLVIKIIGIELQVIFYTIITVFIMNLTRQFEVGFGISLLIFALATVCNIFLNGSLFYCLFPFIHADLTAFIGGGSMSAGFLQTTLYTSGNFFISLAYYIVVVVLLYSFTKQLFKKN